MNEHESSLKYDTELPEDFDGTFSFTNPDDKEFIGIWGKKEYHFPPQTSSPIIILDASPLEVQQIRKKFAKDLAEQMFWKSKGYAALAKQEGTPGNRNMNSIHQAGSYSLNDLEPFIQMCLRPLEKARANVRTIQTTPMEQQLSRNDDGELNSAVVDGKTSLKEKALKASGAVSPASA
jgi:hypothetical protein